MTDQPELFDTVEPGALSSVAGIELPAAPFRKIIVHFASQDNVNAFERTIEQRLPAARGKVVHAFWFPYRQGSFREEIPEQDDQVDADQGLHGDYESFHSARKDWRGMHEFVQEVIAPFRSLEVLFATEADMELFERTVGQQLPPETGKMARSIWFPKLAVMTYKDKRYRDASGEHAQPAYPLYIVSKGRADLQTTSKYLNKMRLPHFTIVERDQLADYERQRHGDFVTFLVLDPEFQRVYDKCLPPEQEHLSTGSGPARNFAWEHSIGLGAARHWVMDDNIIGFLRHNRNLIIPVSDGSVFRGMEIFAERYTNLAMCGPNYYMFVPRKFWMPPFYLNTRIYSCNLIQNDLPHRWRGRYNEDTDLSLRLLKEGRCTVLFNAFVQNKMTTQTARGGNTTEIYGNGTYDKSKMIVDLHPDLARQGAVRLMERYGRWHHFVDYNIFEQQLQLRPDVTVKDGVDNFGMILERRDSDGQWREEATPWYAWEDGR